MKKIILLVIASIFAITTVSAQEAGRWGIAPRIGFYTNTNDDTIFGLGVATRYSFTDNWRIEPGINFLFEDNCSVDISGDVHYVFHVARNWEVYPMAGIGVNEMYDDWSCSFNLGGGASYSVANNWDINASLKWMIQTAKYHSNPILISLGATYKF